MPRHAFASRRAPQSVDGIAVAPPGRPAIIESDIPTHVRTQVAGAITAGEPQVSSGQRLPECFRRKRCGPAA